MSFDANMSVSDGTDTHVYSEISRYGNEAIRRVAAFGTTIPKTLSIKHMRATAAIGGKSDRHIVRNDQVFSYDDSDPTKLAAASVYTIIMIPDVVADKETVAVKLLAENQAVCSASNIPKILNGES